MTPDSCEGPVRRTLLVTAVPPAPISGAGVILENLFADFPSDSLTVVAARWQLQHARATGAGSRWPEVGIRLPRRLTRRGLRAIGNVLRAIWIPLAAVQIVLVAK